MASCNLPHFGLQQAAQGKQSAAELLLCQAEKEICLILRAVHGALEQPALRSGIKLHSRVMSRCEQVCADLLCCEQQLIELKMVVHRLHGIGVRPLRYS